MSTHPNTLLKLTLTPDDLPMKTARAIQAEENIQSVLDEDIKIGKNNYHFIIMDGDYDDGMQVSGNIGDLVLINMATYGYGEDIGWEKLCKMKDELEAWAKATCEKHHCTFKISVSANYW